MVEACGAKFVHMNFQDCTHLVTTTSSVERNFTKGLTSFSSKWVAGY